MLEKGTILSTAFDEYTVVKQIGQGGNGTVFLALTSDMETVAIKAIDKNTTIRDKIKRFRNEINFCQKFSHPNIIKVLDSGVYKNSSLDCLFYAMPHFSSTLREEIKKGIDPENIFNMYSQILSGVEFAHEKGVWHRDIKPENILYESDNQIPVIADFGIAHFCSDDIITSIETKKTDRLANYMYAAPEQRIKGGIVEGRADVFALGLILNEMFTKTVISGTQFRKISDFNKDYGFLDQVVDQMISQEPLKRLFPVNRILVEIAALMKMVASKEELRNIVGRKIDESAEEDPLFSPPTLVDAEIKNEWLILYLDKMTNPTWNNVFTSGSYGHSYVSHYSPRIFTPRNDLIKKCATFSVQISQPPNENLIETIISNFKTWLPLVTAQYTQQEKQKRDAHIKVEILQREQEILAKQLEIKMKEKIKSLL